MEINLTDGGRGVLTRALAEGVEIHFTTVQLGNGANAGSDATALSNRLMRILISELSRGDSIVTLTAVGTNTEVTAGFRNTELGVFCRDPDNSDQEILYAYGYEPEGTADYVPPGADRILEMQMSILIYIGEAENVTAEIADSSVYATKTAFDAHVGNRDNPHEVTAEQIGLGNVENKSANELAPTWTLPAALSALVSGETLQIAFGKIAKAGLSLISHLADMHNPHGVTYKQAGAAPTLHCHSANEITSGILTVERGGTGVGSYAQLSDALPGTTRAVRTTLPANAWTMNSASTECYQQISIEGVTATSVVQAGPDMTDGPGAGELYTRCGAYCCAQGSGALSFRCAYDIPDSDIPVIVLYSN